MSAVRVSLQPTCAVQSELSAAAGLLLHTDGRKRQKSTKSSIIAFKIVFPAMLCVAAQAVCVVVLLASSSQEAAGGYCSFPAATPHAGRVKHSLVAISGARAIDSSISDTRSLPLVLMMYLHATEVKSGRGWVALSHRWASQC